MTVLKKGSRGENVRELQGLLGVDQDSNFGQNTEDKLKIFQAANGLSPDGQVIFKGGKTWPKLVEKNGNDQQKSEANALSPGGRKAAERKNNALSPVIVKNKSNDEDNKNKILGIYVMHREIDLLGAIGDGVLYTIYRVGDLALKGVLALNPPYCFDKRS